MVKAHPICGGVIYDDIAETYMPFISVVCGGNTNKRTVSVVFGDLMTDHDTAVTYVELAVGATDEAKRNFPHSKLFTGVSDETPINICGIGVFRPWSPGQETVNTTNEYIDELLRAVMPVTGEYDYSLYIKTAQCV